MKRNHQRETVRSTCKKIGETEFSLQKNTRDPHGKGTRCAAGQELAKGRQRGYQNNALPERQARMGRVFIPRKGAERNKGLEARGRR